MADAPALGAGAPQGACRFDPDLAYQAAANRPDEGTTGSDEASNRPVEDNREAMHVTSTPAPRSSVLLEVELPPERLGRSVDEAVRRLARRTKVAGFRPGKAPRFMLERVLGPSAVLDEAVDLLLQDAYREAIREEGIVPLAQASVDVVQAEEGKPFKFTATVQVPPEVTLGDYAGFNFAPEIEPTDDARVQTVIDELRDQNATLRPVEDRPAQTGDYAVIGFVGSRDGVPFEGGSSERMPLVLGEERLIPGFEGHLVGLSVGGSTEFDIEFPADYGEATLAGQTAHFAVDLKELREKILPDLDDDFARSMGDFADVEALRVEIRKRLERNALDRARHGFADRIIEYAVANATVELPDILVDQEVEVLHDEFRTSLARQGIAEAGLPQGGRARPRRTSTPSSGRGPRAGSRRSSSCRRSPRSRGSRSPTPTSRPRSPPPGSATPTMPGRWPTSTPSAGGASSGARSAGRGRSRRWSIAGWPPIRITRPLPHFEEDDELSAVDATARRRRIGVTDPSVVLDPRRDGGRRRPPRTAPAEAADDARARSPAQRSSPSADRA